MAFEIHVTPDRLRSTASAFEGTNNQIQSLTSQMTQIITGMSGSIWSGDAASAYIAKFNGLQNDINKIHTMVTEHVTDLQAMATEYESAESSNVSQAQMLRSDVIV